MANREILQLLVHCPEKSRGCNHVTRLADADSHITQCPLRKSASQTNRQSLEEESLTCITCGELVQEPTSTHDPKQLICPNSPVACPFTSAGCTEKIPRKDLQEHVQTQTQLHMQLLCDKLLKLHQIQSSSIVAHHTEVAAETNGDSGAESLPGSSPETGLTRASDIRLSGSNSQSVQKLLKDLFQRVVQLEQRNCQLEISNDQLANRLKTTESQLAKTSSSPEDLGRHCHGRFVWRITDFPEFHDQMRNRHSFVIYSRGFYTSTFGYRLCLRCNISIIDGEEHLGLYVHMMRGENDDILQWPLQAKIKITILNLGPERLHREDFSEIMDTYNLKRAFGRPSEERNNFGFGLAEFIRVNSLYTAGFLSAGNTLVIKAHVEPEEC